MDMTLIPRNEVSVFSQINTNAEKIRRKCQTLLEKLAGLNSVDTLLGVGALVFFVTVSGDQRIRAEVSSTLGLGRFVMSWGRDSDGLVGILLFERKCFDEYDVEVWKPSFSLFVPSSNPPYAKSGAETLAIPVDLAFDNNRCEGIFEVQLGILAAFTQG
jgi:hypothetical protein